jgi:hypothetical protein
VQLADAALMTVSAERAAEKGWLSYHESIEDFTQGVMMEAIEAMGGDYDDPAGCTVCNGGNFMGTTAAEAHAGTHAVLAEDGGPHTFYPDPGGRCGSLAGPVARAPATKAIPTA